ncbi:hypothetical protein [Vreelandella maris]|uniref:hypothetical protein n=1 Tax=Vreelandella maris TaxID=2729617 RepID=UPI0030EDBCF1
MLVRGEGKRYGKKYIYDREDVLIIFEVKRKLSSQSLYEGWRHLSDITRECTKDFIRKVDLEDYEPDMTVVGYYFGAFFKKMPPKKYKDIFNYNKKESMLLFSFLQDSDLPLRILHTFEGYANEVNFRKAYLDVFESFFNGCEGWRVGLPNIPNLVTTGNYAAVKGTGQPHFVRDEEALFAVVSLEGNIAEVLIETIWMKISRFIGVLMPWGEDQQLEKISPLVKCWPREEDDHAGWEYRLLNERAINESSNVMWEPEVLTDFVDSFLNLLYTYEGVDIDGEEFMAICDGYGISKASGLEEVLSTDLFALDDGAIYPIIII